MSRSAHLHTVDSLRRVLLLVLLQLLLGIVGPANHGQHGAVSAGCTPHTRGRKRRRHGGQQVARLLLLLLLCLLLRLLGPSIKRGEDCVDV